MTRGSVVPGNEQIGSGVAGLGDISGDGIGDFAVQWGVDGRWRLYFGRDSAPSTTPDWISEPFLYHPPVVGKFWGGDRKGIVFSKHYDNDIGSAPYFQLDVFDIDGGIPRATPTVIKDSLFNFGDLDILCRDFDGDGADELLVSHIAYQELPEIWIFRGGPGFKLDSPALILRETEQPENADYHVVIGDFDGDHKPDILTGGTYATGQQLKFWFSSRHASVWEWDQPDRVVALDKDSSPSLDFGITAVDCDGDGVMDLIFPAHDGAIRIYRSRAAGKNALDRSFSNGDADRTFDPGSAWPKPVGYLNDRNQRYGMFGLEGGDGKGHGILAIFGGGPNGPDAAYEAYYGASFDGLDDGLMYNFVTPLSDVNGDGWDDLMIGDWHYYDEILHPGIAFILAGGSYIPRDISLGVRDLVAENKRDAISIWPVPAREELHIAWRGDLPRMPERFAVHDLLGRLVAEGSAEAWRGTVVWKCASDPPGLYLLTVFDHEGDPIATATVRVAA
jgi:hypothetical protein